MKGEPREGSIEGGSKGTHELWFRVEGLGCSPKP